MLLEAGGDWSWRKLVLEETGPGGDWSWRRLVLEETGPGGARGWRRERLDETNPSRREEETARLGETARLRIEAWIGDRETEKWSDGASNGAMEPWSHGAMDKRRSHGAME